MPAFVAVIGAYAAGAVGITIAATSTAALVIGSVAIGVLTYAATRPSRLRDTSGTGIASHQVAVRSTNEPRRIVYGQALVSGPIAYINSSGPEERSLFVVISLTGHEIDSFVGVYLDDKFVPIGDVHTLGGAGSGDVYQDTNSHGYAPVGSNPVLYIREHLGTSGQTVDSMLDTYFTDIGTDHRMRGCAYVVLRMDKLAGHEELWQGGMPGNISTVIKGKKVYDPRLDGTFSGTWGSGSGAQRVATPSTWAWSANPALCLADYMIDTDLGPSIASARIDYDSVALAADACDASSAIPGPSTQTRFTCNGVLLTSDTHRENIEKILSSMAGTLRYYKGQWRIRAGTFPSTDFTLDQSHLIGPVRYRKSPERQERFNAVRGTYFDPSRQYKETQYLTVNDTSLQSSRDVGLVIPKDLDLPMTNNEYMAQRIAIRALEQAGETGILVFPTGYNGLNIAPGDTGTVTLPELGWSSRVFRCIGLRHVDFDGVELMLKEDASSAYTDPASGDYGTRSAAGVVTFPTAPARIVGIIRDPNFARAIEDSWSVTSGAGVSISSGGGENGGNALVMTTSGCTVQAAINLLTSETSPGEVLAGQLRAKITSNVTAVNIRANYYRSDTGASLGTQDYAVTAGFTSTGTYYTIPWRLWTPTSYTIGAAARILVALEVRMTPSGGGTATLTTTGVSGDRHNTSGTTELDPNAATDVYTSDYAGPSTFNHGTGTHGTNSVSFTASASSTVEATFTGSATTTLSGGVLSIQGQVVFSLFKNGSHVTGSPLGCQNVTDRSGTIALQLATTAVAGDTIAAQVDCNGGASDDVTVQDLKLRVEDVKR